jgi:hypothetical protein
MSPKIKNIIFFVIILIALVVVYFVFIKKDPEEPYLISDTDPVLVDQIEEEPAITKEFLDLLLGIKGIKIDDQIFSEKTFSSLKDSTIQIINDGNQGRPNPFAPIGSDSSSSSSSLTKPVLENEEEKKEDVLDTPNTSSIENLDNISLNTEIN